VTIQAPGALSKANPAPATATIGQQFSYTITVPATPTNVPLYDVKILDNLAANMNFVGAQATISGVTRPLTYTRTASNIILQDLNTGIDIPAGGQAVIQVTVALQNTTTNFSGASFTNTASYTYDKINGVSSTQANGGAATTPIMTVVEPHLTAAKTASYATPAGKSITSPAVRDDVLRYTVKL
jgi:fimbrial isopeptide formation D2 family protein